MNIRIFLTQIMTLAFVCINLSSQHKLVDYVDPFIGTDGHGHTYPGASFPFGMVQLSPDTDTEGWDWVSGYHYTDSTLIGFSHTHLSGTGVGDYGDILFMPFTGVLKTEPGGKDNPDSGYRSRFSHDEEIARPGYYSVLLLDYDIKAELTVTKRAGFHRYTFPKVDKAHVIIDLVHGIQNQTTDSELEIVDEKTIRGYRCTTGWAKHRCIYFYAEFSKPFKSFGIVESGNIVAGKESSKGRDLKAFVSYNTTQGEEVLIKVGISHTSGEGARKNVKEEIPHWDFAVVKKQAEDAWENELSSIFIESDDERNKTIFYTAMYHALLAPNILSDVDGRYIGMDRRIHSVQSQDRNIYTVFSLWDTFRALHPLFTIIKRERNNELIRSLISKYEEGGLLPVWELASNETETMIGYHSIPVIVDAYFKGIRDFDIEKAYEAMKKSAMQDHHGLESYKEMGYIPADLEHESVSKTLEYAYNDWCIARMAKSLGKDEDYSYFIERAKFWLNVFDPATSLMRPKVNGRWLEPFDPYAVSGHYTEANAWQYSFFVPQDINGLTERVGGDNRFISMLDTLFTTDTTLTGWFQPDITGLIGQYAQGNEPSHHIAYLYNYAGAPWRTQEIVREIITTLYTEKPDGLPGNEDCGQMSAWYVFSALGFYPVTPGDDIYIIGTPLFETATLYIDENRSFAVRANNLSDENFYIQSVLLNGKDYPYSYIRHTDIMDGGELVFEMGSNPSKWGAEADARTRSFIDIPFVPVPYLITGERVFRDSVKVALSAVDYSKDIYYTVDGTNPIDQARIYSTPITIKNSGTLKAVSRKNGMYSNVITAHFNKIPEGRTIRLNARYNEIYTGGGDYALIDGIKGTMNFRTAWQGYEGIDFDAVVDLGKVQDISLINTSFLQNTYSWIFYPTTVRYYISDDGKNFEQVYETQVVPVDEHTEPDIREFRKHLENTAARYVRVYVESIGVCPDWHPGAGGKAWIFIDEIEIE
jgi:predicted alpha-1,2-mannosidase